MPTYEYRCRKCGHQFEVFHGIRDDSIRRCPRCKRRADRVPSAGAGILFKGSGFYITDYRSRDYRERAKKEKEKVAGTGDAAPAPAKRAGEGPGKKRGGGAAPGRE